MVTLELISENEDQKLPKKPQIHSCSYLCCRNPPLPQISTFSLGQKGCAFYGKSAHYECAYYESVQYAKFLFIRSFKFELEINRENAKNAEQAHECLENCTV